MKRITVGGFKNVKRTQICFDKMTALVSPNNYGKSNLLEAIDFGVDFISASTKDRLTMMRWVKGIPINSALHRDSKQFLGLG